MKQLGVKDVVKQPLQVLISVRHGTRYRDCCGDA